MATDIIARGMAAGVVSQVSADRQAVSEDRVAVEAAKADVLNVAESIPEDYSTLSADVGELKSDLVEYDNSMRWIFNPTVLSQKAILTYDGSAYFNSGFRDTLGVTDFIPIIWLKGKTIYNCESWKDSGAYSIAFYDINKNVINHAYSNATSGGDVRTTIIFNDVLASYPNAFYCRIASGSKVGVELSDSVWSDVKSEIESVSENKKDELLNGFEVNLTWTDGIVLLTSGSTLDNFPDYSVSDYIGVTDLIKSCSFDNIFGWSTATIAGACAYDSSKSFLGYIIPNNNTSDVFELKSLLEKYPTMKYFRLNKKKANTVHVDIGYTPLIELRNSVYDLNENPLKVLNDTPELMSCFLNVGCIGDSLASGVAVYKDSSGETVVNSVNRYEYSWGQYLARMTGNKYYNWSAGGLRTDTWLSSSYATECFDGNHLCQAYIIGLGQNDNNKSAGSDIGTSADIDLMDYNNNANSFYGRYGKIIQKILEVQPKAKIFVITDPNGSVDANGYNDAIRTIANMFDNVYLMDMRTYWNDAPCATLLNNQKRYGHFNAVGYFLIAKMMMTYIDWIMQNNWEDFREIENIGTDWYWYE